MDAPLPDWPDDLVAYRRTAEFDAASCPPALQRAHSTKAGVWAQLHVLEGRLRFRDLVAGSEHILMPGVHRIILPQRLHEVALDFDTRFFVEFLSRADPAKGAD